jgi:hypothetical protein
VQRAFALSIFAGLTWTCYAEAKFNFNSLRDGDLVTIQQSALGVLSRANDNPITVHFLFRNPPSLRFSPLASGLTPQADRTLSGRASRGCT